MVIDFMFKKIKARIFHSYETFMDNNLGQLDIHMALLRDMYRPELFNNPKTVEGDIARFLIELQAEVDKVVGKPFI